MRLQTKWPYTFTMAASEVQRRYLNPVIEEVDRTRKLGLIDRFRRQSASKKLEALTISSEAYLQQQYEMDRKRILG